MTPLIQQLLDCMQVRHFSLKTQCAYVRWVYDLAKQTHRSPDKLQDSELKKYLWSLTLERNLSSSSCDQAFHVLNFFYGQVLGRTFSEQLIPQMKRQQKIPELLSAAEVGRIIQTCPQSQISHDDHVVLWLWFTLRRGLLTQSKRYRWRTKGASSSSS